MAERLNDTTDWPDLFVGLYDRLTGSNAEITYASDNMEIYVPSSTSDNAPPALLSIQFSAMFCFAFLSR